MERRQTESSGFTRRAIDSLKYPLIYASTFSGLTGVINGFRDISEGIGEFLVESVETATTNFPFFLGLNLAYAKGVDLATRKCGRIGANLLCATTVAGFHGYAMMTGDDNPLYQSLATLGVGLALTNRQASDVLRQARGAGGEE